MRIFSRISNWLNNKFEEASICHRILGASKHGYDAIPKDLTAFEYKHTHLSRYTGLMDVFEASISDERRRLEIVLQRSVVNNLLAKSDSGLPHTVREGLRAAQRAPV